MTQEIKIRLFGAFRQHGRGPTITVTLTEAATVADLRVALGDCLNDDNARALLDASAFASDERVLEEGESLPDARELAVLPPVCGG